MWFRLFLAGMAVSIADVAIITCLGKVMRGKRGLVACAFSVVVGVDCGECESRCLWCGCMVMGGGDAGVDGVGWVCIVWGSGEVARGSVGIRLCPSGWRKYFV